MLFPAPSLSTGAPLSVLIVNATTNSTRLHALPAGDGGDSALPIACPSAAPVTSCHLHCADSLPRSAVCAPLTDRSSHKLTLTLFIVLRVVYSLCLGTTYTLIDSAVLSFCGQYRVDYGFQRLWGTLAALVVSPLSGKIMDVLSVGEKNFR